MAKEAFLALFLAVIILPGTYSWFDLQKTVEGGLKWEERRAEILIFTTSVATLIMLQEELRVTYKSTSN